jgi:hypothetical protein
LSDEHHAALGGTYRGPKTIAPFTWHLLEAFKQKGWLVTKTKCYERFHKAGDPEPGPQPTEMECRPEMPLWDVLSGTKVLNGMIIIEITDDDVLARTPQKKLGFAIGAHRPHTPSVMGATTAREKAKSTVQLLSSDDLKPQEGPEKKKKKGKEPSLEPIPAEVPPAPPKGLEDAMDDLLAEKKPKKAAPEPAVRKEPVLDPPAAASPPTPADILREEEEALAARQAEDPVTESVSEPQSTTATSDPAPMPPVNKPEKAPEAKVKPAQPVAKPSGNAGAAPAPKPKQKPKAKQPTGQEEGSGLNLSDLLN